MDTVRNLRQLLEQTPELREMLEEQRRASMANTAAIEKALGIRRKHIACPGCGRVIDPRYPEK